MKVYTGYFPKLKSYINEGLIPISIARYSPKWYDGDGDSYFAPSPELLSGYKSGEISADKYTEIYLNQLNRDEVYSHIIALKDKYENKSIILLCYEAPDDFCHRHVLAKYIKDNYGVKVEEFVC